MSLVGQSVLMSTVAAVKYRAKSAPLLRAVQQHCQLSGIGFGRAADADAVSKRLRAYLSTSMPSKRFNSGRRVQYFKSITVQLLEEIQGDECPLRRQ